MSESVKQSKKSVWLWVLLAISLIGLLLVLGLFLLKKSKPSETSNEGEQEPNPEETHRIELTDNKLSLVYGLASKYLQCTEELKRMIIAQSMHETGVFTSALCLDYNNLFGMRFPQQRETTATGETENGFAIYDSLDDSFRDYELYRKSRSMPDRFETITDFSRWLKSANYFEDTFIRYNNALKSHYKTVNTRLQN